MIRIDRKLTNQDGQDQDHQGRDHQDRDHQNQNDQDQNLQESPANAGLSQTDGNPVETITVVFPYKL